MTQTITTPPTEGHAVTPLDVLEQLNSAAQRFATGTAQVIEAAREEIAEVAVHDASLSAHGLNKKGSPMHKVVTDIALEAVQSNMVTDEVLAEGVTTIAQKVIELKRPYGEGAGHVCEGNDYRLSNIRTPTAHAASHAVAGSDPIDPSTLGLPTSVEAKPDTIVMRDAEGNMHGNITGTARYA